MKKALLIPLAAMLVLAACSPSGEPVDDPYADPGTPPPPTITDPTVGVAFSMSEPAAGDIITLNVPGFAPVEEAEGLSTSAADMFTVVEDGVVKGIIAEEIDGGTRAAADIAFVFDTTGSMGGALRSVITSIIGFADHLDSSGLDVRLGAVTFGDAFDTKAEGSTSPGTGSNPPPAFDPTERPMFALTDDSDSFREFIQSQTASGGGFAAENAVGALSHAHGALDWRAGAQCVLILITDIYAWEAPDPGSQITEIGGPITEPWIPPSSASVVNSLRGDCVVHVIATSRSATAGAVHTSVFTGTAGTGGVYHEWDGREFDLSELPITGTLTSGYVVRYRGTVDGSEHEVRLVVDDGAARRGEHTRTATY